MYKRKEKKLEGRIVPHCEMCQKPYKKGDIIIVSDLYNVQHAECYAGDEKYILHKGPIEEVGLILHKNLDKFILN
jgi:hypothetical protein